MNKLLLIFILVPMFVCGQSFAPEPGQPGSTAIHMDSSVFVDWADSVVVERGYLNIAFPGWGAVSYGTEQDAIGPADGSSVISLGDGGIATVFFNSPIINGSGPDFAVFENGFIDHYMELAFVEVSSDSVNFFRFDGISEIPTSVQLTNFSTSNCAFVHNLAGKYRTDYGTPFDLQDLAGISGLDINHIVCVRLIDVIGSILPPYQSFDSQGNVINDPYPTDWESGGFDLEAVGIIHSELKTTDLSIEKMKIYPNPTTDKIFIGTDNTIEVFLYSVDGKLMMISDEHELDLSTFSPGLYRLVIQTPDRLIDELILKN